MTAYENDLSSILKQMIEQRKRPKLEKEVTSRNNGISNELLGGVMIFTLGKGWITTSEEGVIFRR